ncbi:MAG: hypothetical protein KDA45_12945, partial [Planctomycetales bacterium]|nr:hypothetical protein [Planctomycetales bacterium]
ERADDDVDRLYGSIVTYLGKLAQQNLVGAQPTELYQYIGIANQLENVGDVIVNDLLVDARKRIHQGVVVSPQTLAVLSPLHERVCWAFERARQALENGNLDAAHEANESKMQVRQLADTAASHLAKRLTAYDPKRLATFQVESGIIESLKRLNTLTRRVARAVLEVDNGPPTASSGQPTAAGAV